MTAGRFAHRVQAGLLVQEVHRTTGLFASIEREADYYAVILRYSTTERPPIATLRSWADWETWKLSHPDKVFGQLPLFPPTE